MRSPPVTPTFAPPANPLDGRGGQLARDNSEAERGSVHRSDRGGPGPGQRNLNEKQGVPQNAMIVRNFQQKLEDFEIGKMTGHESSDVVKLLERFSKKQVTNGIP